ncbi:reverse transcriptase domain-containing protein [Tanacetum coccineum]
MVNQIKGLFKARKPTIKQYLQTVKEILKGFDTYTIEHIRRNQNKKADALRKLVSMTFEHLIKEVLVEVLVKSLVYGSKAIILSTKSLAPEGKGYATKENVKRKEDEEREIASIKEAYFQNKLCRYHNIRSNRSTFKTRDFVLLLLSSTYGQQVWQGSHMVSGVYEGNLYKITDASDYSLVQTAKGTSLRKFYM